LKFWVNGPCWSEITDFQPIFAPSSSAVTPSETSSINTNRKSTTRFPMSLRWYRMLPLSPPKAAQKRKTTDSRLKSHFAWRKSAINIGKDLAALLGGTHGERRRWVRAEWGGVWRGVSPLQPTKGSEGASWAPPAGSGVEPRPKTDFGVFWRPQNAHFCTYMTKSGETICIIAPRSKFWGRLVPPCPHRDLRPWLQSFFVWKLSAVSGKVVRHSLA